MSYLDESEKEDVINPEICCITIANNNPVTILK
jgi:hypothetical protein